MQWLIALHMHGEIILNGVSAWLIKNQQCVWCLIGLVWQSGMKSNRVARLNNVVKKTYVGLLQEEIDTPSGERPVNCG